MPFEVVRDAAAYVDAENGLIGAAAVNLFDKLIIDDRVAYHIFTNELGLLSDKIICALARIHKLQFLITMLSQVEDIRNNPVRHKHRHLDFLHES